MNRRISRCAWYLVELASLFAVLNLATGSLVSPAYAQQDATAYDTAAAAYQNRDFSTAETQWEKLADAGDANAQYALAVMHLKSEARTPSRKTAHQLLKNAAEQGHLTAMFNLGVSYWEGAGVKVNKAQALKWWQTAAEKDDSGAQFNLGLAYYIGDGREKDVDQAMKWVKRAEKNGHPQASQLLAAIEKELQSSQQKAAQKATSTDPSSATKQQSESRTKPEEKQVVDLRQPTRPAAKATASIDTQAATIIAPEPAKSSVRNQPESAKAVADKQTNPALQTHWQTKGVVTSIRSRPNADAIELKTLKPGTPLKFLKEKGEWLKVHVPGNFAVWVHKDFVTGEQQRGEIKGSNVNVRPMPAINKADAAPVAQLNTGDKVQIVLRRDDWVKIVPTQLLPAWIQKQDAYRFRASNTQHAQAWAKFQ